MLLLSRHAECQLSSVLICVYFIMVCDNQICSGSQLTPIAKVHVKLSTNFFWDKSDLHPHKPVGCLSN